MKKNYIIFILLIFFSNLTIGENIDSLTQKANNSKGVELISTYNKISYYYYHTNRDSTYKYSNKAISLLRKHPNKLQTIEAYNIQGMIASNIGFYEESFNFLFDALKIAEEIKDTFQISRLNNNIGVSYMQIKDYNKGESFLKEAIKYKNNKKVRIGPIYNNLGLIMESQRKYDEALDYFNLAYQNYVIDNDSVGIASTTGNIGSIQIRINKVEEGYQKLLVSYNQCILLDDHYRLAIVLNKIAIDYYLRKKEYNKSINYLWKSLNISTKENIPELIYDDYMSLAMVHTKINSFDSALIYLTIGQKTKDSIYSNSIKSIIADINIRYEDVKKNKTIELLRAEKNINDIKHRWQRIWIILLSAIALIFSIIGYVIYRYNAIQHDINEHIVSKNIEIVRQEEEIDINTNNNIDYKYLHSHLESDTENEIANKIIEILKREKLFKNPDFTINSLADYLNTNRTYVSQVINSYFNMNFNSLINEYRVKEARKILSQDTNLSIEGVSIEVGFRSKSVFNGAFKKHTGVTPSVFITNSQKQKKS